MYIKPTAGVQVPDPYNGGYLPPEGRVVEPTQYWLRRIADGDAVEAKPEIISTRSKTQKGSE